MVADNLAVETVVHLECLACNPSVDTYRMVLPLAYQPSVRHMVAGHIHTPAFLLVCDRNYRSQAIDQS
jgi:hypothetical protein